MANKECIAVFGASGKTGQAVLRAAWKKGLGVRALYRPGSDPPTPPPDLQVIRGQLTSPDDVRETLTGAAGAILAFGPRLRRGVPGDVFCAAATREAITAMKALGVARLVCQTGAMAGGDHPNWSWGVRRFVGRYREQFPTVAADRDAQEEAVNASGLDWLIARPFRISGAKAKGSVRAGPDLRIGMLTSTRRDDLATFLVDQVVRGTLHRTAVFVIS